MLPLKESFVKSFGAVKSFEKIMIGCNVNTFKGSGGHTRSVNLSFEWSSPNSWYTGNLAWQERGGSKVVYGLHMSSLEAPLKDSRLQPE
jgi:hypothetical protein